MGTIESFDRSRKDGLNRLRFRWFLFSLAYFSGVMVIAAGFVAGMNFPRTIEHVVGPFEILKAPMSLLLPHLAIFVLILHLEVIGIWHRKPVLIVLGWVLFTPWWLYMVRMHSLAGMLH